MNKTWKQIKSISRENLLGKYPLPIGATLLYQVICDLISLPFIRMIYQGTTGKTSAIPLVVAGIAGLVIVILLAAIFNASVLGLHMKIARREDIAGRDLLYSFQNHPDKFAGFSFLLAVILFVCIFPGGFLLGISAASHAKAAMFAGSILLLAAGAVVFIWLLLSWSMAVFYLLDDPYSITVTGAIRKSFHSMKGNRRKLFGLTVSFIGLAALGLLSFGIGLLWVKQYYNQSVTLFYMGLDHQDAQNQNA